VRFREDDYRMNTPLLCPEDKIENVKQLGNDAMGWLFGLLIIVRETLQGRMSTDFEYPGGLVVRYQKTARPVWIQKNGRKFQAEVEQGVSCLTDFFTLTVSLSVSRARVRLGCGALKRIKNYTG